MSGNETTTTTQTPLIDLRNIHFAYPGQSALLRGLDLALGPGDRLALRGANGAGKTTVLHLIVGLLRPVSGRVRAFGVDCRSEADFRDVRPRVGLVFQDADDQLFCPSVLEDVAFGPLNLGMSEEAARAAAAEALAKVGLAHCADHVPHKLSGGEKRLAAIATVLAMKPDALLLDEPTSGLDDAAHERLLRLLTNLPQAMIIVSHDEPLVRAVATRTGYLREGRLEVSG